MPTGKQWKIMLQKLMVNRFKPAIHREMKELPVYVLSIGRDGPKLTKGDPNGAPIMDFGAFGTMHATSATMTRFRLLPAMDCSRTDLALKQLSKIAFMFLCTKDRERDGSRRGIEISDSAIGASFAANGKMSNL
jgi:uncharacterized protein (TIGR03435 family)